MIFQDWDCELERVTEIDENSLIRFSALVSQKECVQNVL